MFRVGMEVEGNEGSLTHCTTENSVLPIYVNDTIFSYDCHSGVCDAAIVCSRHRILVRDSLVHVE